MAIHVKKLDENTSELIILNYVDMTIKKGNAAFIFNAVNRNFFNKIYSRAEKWLTKEK